MATKICFTMREFDHPITLRQSEETGLYSLQYGEQQTHFMSQAKAMVNLTRAMFHAMSTKGLIEADEGFEDIAA